LSAVPAGLSTEFKCWGNAWRRTRTTRLDHEDKFFKAGKLPSRSRCEIGCGYGEITNVGGKLTSKQEVTEMPDRSFPSEKVRFDVFEADFRAGELLRDGRRVRLQEQPCRVLFLLLQRAGEVVTREELRERLWPADTFVDFDHGLNSAVARLRDALHDSADKPRFIETIAKRGYRFIAPLQNEVAAPASTGYASATKGTAGFMSARFWAAASICLALLCTMSIWAAYRPRADAQLAKIEVVPLVGLRGFQATPAFSPDGTLVAFRQSDGAQNTGIYAAVVGGEKSVQLTNDPGDCCPTWSPDGRQIAFSRYTEKILSILTIPALGGTEHRLYRGASSMGAGLSWSPDGQWLAFSESSESDPTRAWISVMSLADSSTRVITAPPPGSLDRAPAYSPDGRKLAFIRSTTAGVSNDIYVMPASGGRAKRLTFDHRPIMGPPTWTRDSREIVFSSNRGAATGLWRVSAEGCIPSPIAGPVGEAEWPTIPWSGENALVYEQGMSEFNIWRLDLKDPKHAQRAPLSVISEKGDKMRPEISPDGKKIAFESDRLGFWEIWTCAVDGSDCNQITALHGTAGRARWSPDGRYIAFEYHPNERSEIYIVEIPGGVPHLLRTIPGADNLSPSWSRDGKWIYFASKRGSEAFQIWRMAVGSGSPVQITQHGGISPVESRDGRDIYYSKLEQGGVWRMPLQGGDETEVLSEVSGGGWPDWELSGEGIYYLKFGKFPEASIAFLDFATGKKHTVWNLEKKVGWGISLSPDDKSIVYVQNEFAQSNIMLVKNFR
jgi:Tol biopolymer transport system component/DNA-binding winged helix-turn-helix (wHTH) protein